MYAFFLISLVVAFSFVSCSESSEELRARKVKDSLEIVHQLEIKANKEKQKRVADSLRKFNEIKFLLSSGNWKFLKSASLNEKRLKLKNGSSNLEKRMDEFRDKVVDAIMENFTCSFKPNGHFIASLGKLSNPGDWKLIGLDSIFIYKKNSIIDFKMKIIAISKNKFIFSMPDGKKVNVIELFRK